VKVFTDKCSFKRQSPYLFFLFNWFHIFFPVKKAPEIAAKIKKNAINPRSPIIAS